MSQEYIGAIVIAIVGGLQLFGIQVANEAITGLVVGIIAIYVAFRRHQKGDISIVGVRK